MSEIKVNKISPRTACGTTQLGDSGDTFNLPSGATLTVASGATITNNGTQTGFGREGSVNWQTGSIKTTNFNAANGEGYFADTSSGAFTMTLPSSPSAGNIVAVKDYANTFDSNALTIGRNGSNIGGVAADAVLSAEGTSITLVYVDATKGWLVTSEGAQSDAGQPTFIEATGGTVTTSGNFKIHTFTGPGTFQVTQLGNAPTQPSGGPSNLDYLVVAGGGAGFGGGGGAGGVRFFASPDITSYPASPRNAPAGITATVTSYPITVGGGGGESPGPNYNTTGSKGSNSIFSTITSHGGGTGGNSNGGSGGGGHQATPGTGTNGTGNTPPVTPSQGSNGGSGSNPGQWASGGGGGFMGVGGNFPGGSWCATGGAGGPGGGFPTTFVGTNGIPSSCEQYFGGGGGGQSYGNPGGTMPNGGLGGGGKGGIADGSGPAPGPSFPSDAGTVNTGGGGGGTYSSGSAGGSGIVIIRYKFQ
jgi:hypothetical protein